MNRELKVTKSVTSEKKEQEMQSVPTPSGCLVAVSMLGDHVGTAYVMEGPDGFYLMRRYPSGSDWRVGGPFSRAVALVRLVLFTQMLTSGEGLNTDEETRNAEREEVI